VNARAQYFEIAKSRYQSGSLLFRELEHEIAREAAGIGNCWNCENLSRTRFVLFRDMESDAAFFRNWFRRQNLIDRVDDGGDLLAVLVLLAPQILDGADELFVSGEDFAELHERADDKDIHLNGALAPKD
jgi:hypothetical protein